MDSITQAIGLFAKQNLILVMGGTYVAVILGGNITAFVAFWAAFALNLKGWQMLALIGLVAGAEFTGDCLWFSLGKGLRNTRFGDWVKRRLPGHDRMESAIQRKGRRLIYLCKFAYGSAGVLGFLIGWTGMDFRMFLKNAAMSILFSVPIVFIMVYGLFSGIAPLGAVDSFKHFERLFLVGIAAFFVLEWLLGKAVKIVFSGKEDGD